ncbi:hypothetical protein KIN20_017901 [Parelaphostrongylus tenuis]|uniref:Uncharacterized protein n=1 Tax=Parelaphostrongylus tenuis TaxID=148309 RepID=A0AAD5QRR3_PARTN|nr:hypothetical protein KIN20_017901 [Parelaphostrongylus tenuis]
MTVNPEFTFTPSMLYSVRQCWLSNGILEQPAPVRECTIAMVEGQLVNTVLVMQCWTRRYSAEEGGLD